MSEWIKCKDKMPDLPHEMEDDPNDEGYCQFYGFVSQSIEISDGQNFARGHYRDDGKWIIYHSDHDFLMVNPNEVTHWMSMPELPD